MPRAEPTAHLNTYPAEPSLCECRQMRLPAGSAIQAIQQTRVSTGGITTFTPRFRHWAMAAGPTGRALFQGGARSCQRPSGVYSRVHPLVFC